MNLRYHYLEHLITHNSLWQSAKCHLIRFYDLEHNCFATETGDILPNIQNQIRNPVPHIGHCYKKQIECIL